MSNRPGPLAQRIAAELRAELGRQNLSRRWLAEQIGLSHVTVSRWVNGDGGMTFDALDAMCQALGMSVADLLAAVERNSDQPLPAPRPPRGRRSRAIGDAEPADSGQESGRDTHEYATVAA